MEETAAPRIVLDGVRAWLVDLTASGDGLLALEEEAARLSAEELARGRDLSARGDAARWLAAHIALRLVLERFAGAAVRQRPFEQTAQGKPFLPDCDLGFSLSHSSGHALIAIGPSGPLGADLECRRAIKMSPTRQDAIISAAADMSAQPLPARAPDKFLQAWVRLEALAKADGVGIGRVLSQAGAFGPRRGQGAVGINPAGLVVRDLAAGEGLFAALAHDPKISFKGLAWCPAGRDGLRAFVSGEAGADQPVRPAC